jgi:hypothetical protein
MKQEGILRISGTQSRIEELRLKIDRAQPVNYHVESIFDLSGLMKFYFRCLPEPPVPFDFYNKYFFLFFFLFFCIIKFNRAVGIIEKFEGDEVSLQKEIISFFENLPEGNRKLILFILGFLHKITTYSESNKMKSYNLSIVFAPNLLRYNGDSIDLTSITRSNSLVKEMIDNFQVLKEHFKL